MDIVDQISMYLTEHPKTQATAHIAGLFIAGYISLKLLKKTLIFIYRKSRGDKRRSMEGKPFEKDMVYLHMFPRNYTKQVPNLSPYGLKVECWLRLKDIKYQLIETIKQSTATRQLPYVYLNGKEYADSNLIIDTLTDHFGLDPTEGLSPEHLGVRRAFTALLDESTAYTYMLPRYAYSRDVFAKWFRPEAPWPMHKLIAFGIGKFFEKRAIAQGIGRKTPEEVSKIGQNDLRAISLYLGDKKYFLGDLPSLIDCIMFGHLCQVVYVDMPYTHKDVLDTECTNIRPCLDRIKTRLWPDWDNIVDKSTFL